MPDLSACYFCGTALDEPLSEYPVVPRPLQPTPDQQRTVVLCSSCRRKLGTVVDSILDAIDERPGAETIQQDLAESGAAGSTLDDSETAESVDESTGATTPAADETADADAGTEEGTSAADAPETDTADEADEAPSAGPDVTSDLTPTPDAERSEDDGAHSSTSEVEGGGDERHVSGADEATEDGPTLSALEYTKVMRLLENRELPVDREEIRVVATNAYEIRPAEFDAVVDAAVERGMIVEEDGQFVAID